mgnify:CR=1 FL=1
MFFLDFSFLDCHFEVALSLKYLPFLLVLATAFFFSACQDQGGIVDCNPSKPLDSSRGVCGETLTAASSYSESLSSNTRTITANSIPNHMVGLFGGGQGSLNPNAISAQSETYSITMNPVENASLTALLSTSGSGPNAGPQYSFGVLL